MNCKNLIKNAYKYYDEKMILYEKIHHMTGLSKDEHECDLEVASIKFYINKKIISEANYEIMGRYYKKDNIFIWAWADVDNVKNLTYISKQILNYGLDIVIDNSLDNKDEFNLNSFLKMLLINSRIVINNQVELDILTYISFYLSKKDWFITITDPKNSDQVLYLFLYNIKLY
jgi:hypothetical protein